MGRVFLAIGALALALALGLALVVDTAAAGSATKSGAKRAKDGEAKAPLSDSERAAIAESKLATFQAHALASRDGLVAMNITGYNALIRNAPRSYHIMLAFTVRKPSRNCEPCNTMHDVLGEVSRGFLRGVRAGEHKHDIFFVEIDYDVGGMADVFSRADVKYTPLLAYIPPSLTGVLADKPYLEDNVYDLRRYPLAADALCQFITMRTGVEIDTATPLPLVQIVLAVTTVVGLGWWLQAYIARVVPFPVLFGSGFLVVTTLCLAGLPYYYIRKTPWSAPAEKGMSAYVAPHQRNQYGLEAVFVAGIIVACSTSLAVVAVWVPSRTRFAWVPGYARCSGVLGQLELMALPIGMVLAVCFLAAVSFMAVVVSAKMGNSYPFSVLNIRSLLDYKHFGKFSSL